MGYGKILRADQRAVFQVDRYLTKRYPRQNIRQAVGNVLSKIGNRLLRFTPVASIIVSRESLDFTDDLKRDVPNSFFIYRRRLCTDDEINSLCIRLKTDMVLVRDVNDGVIMTRHHG